MAFLNTLILKRFRETDSTVRHLSGAQPSRQPRDLGRSFSRMYCGLSGILLLFQDAWVSLYVCVCATHHVYSPANTNLSSWGVLHLVECSHSIQQALRFHPQHHQSSKQNTSREPLAEDKMNQEKPWPTALAPSLKRSF